MKLPLCLATVFLSFVTDLPAANKDWWGPNRETPGLGWFHYHPGAVVGDDPPSYYVYVSTDERVDLGTLKVTSGDTELTLSDKGAKRGIILTNTWMKFPLTRAQIESAAKGGIAIHMSSSKGEYDFDMVSDTFAILLHDTDPKDTFSIKKAQDEDEKAAVARAAAVEQQRAMAAKAEAEAREQAAKVEAEAREQVAREVQRRRQHIAQIAKDIHEAFSMEAAARYGAEGTSLVTGQAFLKTRGGDVKLGAGETIFLIPAPFQCIMEGLREDLGWIDMYSDFSSDERVALDKTLRTTVADASGGYEFENIPAGVYVLAVKITWEIPSTDGHGLQGGWVVKPLVVSPDSKARLMLTE